MHLNPAWNFVERVEISGCVAANLTSALLLQFNMNMLGDQMESEVIFFFKKISLKIFERFIAKEVDLSSGFSRV